MSSSKLSLEEHIALLKLCSKHKEVAAAVYIYDSFKESYPNSIESVKDVMLSMHSKKLQPNDTIVVQVYNFLAFISLCQVKDGKKLDPKRRIHKICKGWQVKDRNSNVADKKEEVKLWVLENKDQVENCKGRTNLARLFEKKFSVTRKEGKTLVTNMKQRKVLKEEKGGKFTVIG